MPRTSLDTNDIKKVRRAQIAEAALKVFSVKSFLGATMTDIAKEAKISHGLIYHYFKDKQEIFDYADSEKSAEVFDALMEIDRVNFGFQDKFRAVAEFFLKEKNKDEFFAYRFFAMVSKRFADLSSAGEVKGCKHKPRGVGRFLIGLFEEGEREGKLAHGMNAQTAAQLFFTVVMGNNLGAILKPDKKGDNIINLVINLFTVKENNT